MIESRSSRCTKKPLTEKPSPRSFPPRSFPRQSDELQHLVEVALGGGNRRGQSFHHVFHADPFPWQTGDPFWDGFKLTYELKTISDEEVETIYHITATTLEQKDRFLALMNLAEDSPKITFEL